MSQPTFQTITAADLQVGDEVIDRNPARSFRVLSKPTAVAHWLLDDQLKMMGAANGRSGWVTYGAHAQVTILARSKELAAA